MDHHRDHPTFESWLTSMKDLNVFPTLQTERLVLRQMKIDDATELHRAKIFNASGLINLYRENFYFLLEIIMW
jgi:hypothetical protein